MNTEALQNELGHLLARKIIHFESVSRHGYDRQVHHVRCRMDSGAVDDLVIKIADDSLGYSFYREVLVPCQLNSPTIHGTITLDGELFMVMDFIPHLPTTWHENWRYERAVDWLAMKDKRMSSVCSKRQSLTSIHSDSYSQEVTELRMEVLKQGAIAGVCDRLTPSLCSRIQNALFSWREVFASTTQTICHNDFQMQNILFGEGTREDELYVIDWTFPRWESVCIDLAWLLQTAPVPIRDRMINRYATQHPCSFHPGLPAADAHMAFCVAVNLIESALENGRDEKQRRHLDRLVLQLVNACDT